MRGVVVPSIKDATYSYIHYHFRMYMTTTTYQVLVGRLQIIPTVSKRSYRNSIGRNSQLDRCVTINSKNGRFAKCTSHNVTIPERLFGQNCRHVSSAISHWCYSTTEHATFDLKYWFIIHLLIILPLVRVRVWFARYRDIVGHCFAIFTGHVINHKSYCAYRY